MECEPRGRTLEFAFEPLSTRPVHENAPVSNVYTHSLAEMQSLMAFNSRPCRFCGNAIQEIPFNPMALVQVHAMTTSRPFSVHMNDEQMCDEDGDSCDDDDTPQSNSCLSSLDMLLSQPMHCCSAQCWMANSLIIQGERSPIGSILLQSFPALSPNNIGGDHLAMYENKREIMRQEIYARNLARAAINAYN